MINRQRESRLSKILSSEQYNSFFSDLGNLPDVQIAKKYRLAIKTIRHYKHQLNIRPKKES